MKYQTFNFRKVSTLVLLTFLTVNLSATTAEKTVKTAIKDVTVFLKGAQINRTANVAVPAGKSVLKLTDLSPYIDKKSVQVNISNANITILGVNHQYEYIDKQNPTPKIKALKEQITELNEQIERENIELNVINSEQKFIAENISIKSNESGVSFINLKQINQYYNERNRKLQTDKMNIDKRIKALREKRADLQKELVQEGKIDQNPMSEVLVEVESSVATNVLLNLSYYTENASWFPSYDIRTEDIAKPVQLSYKANIRQNTREEWKNVKLKISSLNPQLGNTPPQLQPYYLDYYTAPPRYDVMNIDNLVQGVVLDSSNEPLRGVIINIVGTSISTVSDLNGKFSLPIPAGGGSLNFSFIGMLSKILPITPNKYMTVVMEDNKEILEEVIVTGYGQQEDISEVGAVYSSKQRKSVSNKSKPLPVLQAENQTSIEMEIVKPYTVLSDNKLVTIEMQRLEIPAQYEYIAIPKVDKDAFLMARIADWEKYQLLEGEANIFNGNQFVGKTILDTRSVADTLNIAMGRDKGIQINREKQKEFTKKQFFSSKQEETRAWKTTVRNNKQQAITLILLDQVPVSTNSDIEVILQQLSGGKLNEKNGEVEWKFKLNPTEKNDVDLIYSVKYPKDRNLIIE